MKKDKKLSLRVDPRLRRALEDLADRERRSMSNVIRNVLEDLAASHLREPSQQRASA